MNIIKREDISLKFSKGYKKPKNNHFKNAQIQKIKDISYYNSYYQINSSYFNIKLFLSRYLYSAGNCIEKPFFQFNVFKDLHKNYNAWDIDCIKKYTESYIAFFIDNNDNLFLAMSFPMWYGKDEKDSKSIMTYRSSAYSDIVYEIILDDDLYENVIYTINKLKISEFNYNNNINNIFFLVVRDRTALFEVSYMKSIEMIHKSVSLKKSYLFLRENYNKIFDNNGVLLNDFLKDQKYLQNIVLVKNDFGIPILEKINDQWIFYRHNYNKYQNDILNNNIY